jgi:hypothetical protein
MGTLNFVLDIVLIVAAAWMLYVVRQSSLGGTMGRTLTYMTIGTMLLGFAHILETVMLESLGASLELTELIHRLVVLAGFVLLTIGIRPLMRLR